MTHGLLIGIDMGGTFTDGVLIDEEGGIATAKAASTPGNLAEGFMTCLEALAANKGVNLSDLLRATAMMVNCNTVGTNAMIERTGCKVGLITTKGHESAIRIMRVHGRSAGLPPEKVLRVVELEKPTFLVSKELIVGVNERVDSSGAVVVALGEDEVSRAIQQLEALGAEAIAICFLWSIRNPVHERLVRDIVRASRPSRYCVASSDICHRVGEYERVVATAINCYIGPRLFAYVDQLRDRLAQEGFRGATFVGHCGGGVITEDQSKTLPYLTIDSGPVSGLIASRFLAGKLGSRNVITVDMGGTSFDVGLILEGELARKSTNIIQQYEYFVPAAVDVASVGAGGGSIARVDELTGALRVGPISAGARPGPMCYGQGGTEPTVTDADVVLGVVNPQYFLGGQMRLDADLALKGLADLGSKLRTDAIKAAAGVCQVVDSTMSDFVRQKTVQSGYDPRDFVMFAYGGAGPTHAAAIARAVGVSTVVVPGGQLAAAWSALGALLSEAGLWCERSVVWSQPMGVRWLEDQFSRLEDWGKQQIMMAGIQGPVKFRRFALIRYEPQYNELEIEVPPGPMKDEDLIGVLAAFEARYDSLFGKGAGMREAGFAISTLRVEVTTSLPRPGIRQRQAEARALQASDAPARRRVFWYEEDRFLDTPVYRDQVLREGDTFQGPAIVELPATTVVVRPGQSCSVDGYRNFVITCHSLKSQK